MKKNRNEHINVHNKIYIRQVIFEVFETNGTYLNLVRAHFLFIFLYSIYIYRTIDRRYVLEFSFHYNLYNAI